MPVLALRNEACEARRGFVAFLIAAGGRLLGPGGQRTRPPHASGTRSFPPPSTTKQVAAQEGKYLAQLFNRHVIAAYPGPAPPSAGPAIALADRQWVPMPEAAAPFQYRHGGSFA